jgi:hypothetical protein
MTDDREPAGLFGTYQQQLVFLNTHWGSKYTFAAPRAPGGPWTATAKFGQHDQMQNLSSAELLKGIREHYRASRPDGGSDGGS